MSTLRKIYPSESQEQTALIRWADLNNDIGPYLIHIPNGGSRNPAEAANLKRQGVRAGVSDLLLARPRGQFHGLWIELKRNRLARPKISESQIIWINRVREEGYAAEVCYGFDEAKEVISRYINIKSPPNSCA